MALAFVFYLGCRRVAQQSPLTLWYNQPANLWVEALPVGNGRMGAMIFGGIANERIQFNEKHRLDRRAARLRPQRRLPIPGPDPRTAVGRQAEGGRGPGDAGVHERPMRQKAYQPFGDLELEYPGVRPTRSPATAGRSTWIPASPPSSLLRTA